MTDRSLSLAVKPIIHYPREAQVGKTYLMTIDLQMEEGFEWQYEEEEYPVYCTVDSELFSSQPVGEPAIVMHRFGGSYGAVKFLLTTILEVAQGTIKIILINAWGIPVKSLILENISTTSDYSLGEIVDHNHYRSATILDNNHNNSRKILYSLPSQSYIKFIGRDKEIQTLTERISSNYHQHFHVVNGIGGVGKTALVLEVAYRCLEAKNIGNKDRKLPNFDAIIFTSSKATNFVGTQLLNRPEKESTLLDIFRVIATTLEEQIITQLPTDRQLEEVKKALAKQPTLLIVDNMETLAEEDKEQVLDFLNNVPQSTQVIITTREGLGLPPITIEQLTKQESYQLIDSQARSKKITIIDSQKNQIYKRFNGIPLAMIYAVGQRGAGYDFADILKQTLKLPSDLGRFCFEGSITPLRGTVAHKLLMAITFFDDSSCENALSAVAGLNIKQRKAIIDGLLKLQQLCLIAKDNNRYIILPITREYALDELKQCVDPDIQEVMKDRWLQWYLNLTKQHGGNDWGNWRHQYKLLEEEWININSALHWYENHEEWDKVLELWEQIDGYVDLNGYWQKRCHWWNLIYEKSDRKDIKIKALSEKSWTSILMGMEYHEEAEKSLRQAWKLRQSAEKGVQVNIANHLAVLEKVRGKYLESQQWLEKGSKILQEDRSSSREKIRSQIQNLYYQAEINQLSNNRELAKEQFVNVIEMCHEIEWQRFLNYAHNSYADILIEELNLEEAKFILENGLAVAKDMRMNRQMALYHASYARLYYQKAKQSKTHREYKRMLEYIGKSKEYILKAEKVFKKESMQKDIESIVRLENDIEKLSNRPPTKV